MSYFSKLLLLFSFFLNLTSCNNNFKQCNFNFEGFDIELPSTIREIKTKIPLTYKKYIGFTYTFDKIQSDYRMCSIQTENSPYWESIDNVEEKYFYDEKVVGVIFSRNYDSLFFSNLKNSVSLEYNCVFIKKHTQLGERKIYFEVALVKNNCTIVLSKSSDVLRLCFYSGVSNKELIKYIHHAL